LLQNLFENDFHLYMECVRTLLSGKRGLGSVEQCSCGSIHVTIGAVTLRLAACALPTLAELLTEGSAALAAQSRSADDASEVWS
jgi:hypothetical protein